MSTVLGIVIFASEAAEEEGSHALFYACGLALAVWAVLVSALGITKHDFPSSNGAARGVMAISALLVVAATASAVIAAG